MSGQTWPAELPDAYQARYGGNRLHDRAGPELSPTLRARVEESVDVVIHDVRRVHKLE
jgi:hypothetical protein